MATTIEFPLAEIKKKKRQKKLYTLGEYLEKEERSQERHVYYNGEIKKLPIARGPHNILAVNFGHILKNELKKSEKNTSSRARNKKSICPN